MKLRPIEEQVVVITGATSGIGRAAALEFARRGAKVVVSGRSQSAVDALVDEIRGLPAAAIGFPAEVKDYHQLKALADRAAETYGRIDTWVHSAAVMMYASVRQTDPEEYRQMLEVNLLGQIYGAQAALPYLERQGGALILIGSGESKRALPLQSAYAASKFGLVGFADALRVELAHANAPVSVTSILPAGINTPLYDKALTRLGTKPRPLGVFYQPEEVARAILYAAEHPVRDLYVGSGARLLDLVERISPRLVDFVLERMAFRGQRTEIPKSPSAPNNLYQHLAGHDQVRGSLGHKTWEISPYTRWRTNPAARWAVSLLALAGGAFFFARRSLKIRGS
jgi:NAD(P)-dependent dehydrogenase (short-subunit alcohol dehydrogenase family)